MTEKLTLEKMMADLRDMGVFEAAERRMAEKQARAHRIWGDRPQPQPKKGGKK